MSDLTWAWRRFGMPLVVTAMTMPSTAATQQPTVTASPPTPPVRKASIPPDPRTGQYYAISEIVTPHGIDPRFGGLAATADGRRLVAAFHRGQIAFYDPTARKWRVFAEGLHEPLGVVAESDGSVIVMQRPELTRVRDSDGDGIADRFETLWDGFGMVGNYHEYAFGPARGPDGKLYVALDLAGNGEGIREEIRGPWNPIGMSRDVYVRDRDNKSLMFKTREEERAFQMEHRSEMGEMHSRVPWRGWVVQIDPVTRVATPYASGFRAPDGIGFDAEGRLIVDDNQGDWVGTNQVYVVQRDAFYGHPASLLWRTDWDGGSPYLAPLEKLAAMRTPPAIQIPYARWANSPTQMLPIPKTRAWGPFGGQLVAGEIDSGTLLRFLPEEVDGVWQGACVELLVDTPRLHKGLHRFAFVGDTLYVGRTDPDRKGGGGLAALWPRRIPFDPVTMHATRQGFQLTFTEPLAPSATDVTRWSVQRYFYEYHAAYGSPEMEKATVTVSSVTLTDDRRGALVELADLKPGFVYEFDLRQLRSVPGDAPLNPRIAYTLNRVPR